MVLSVAMLTSMGSVFAEDVVSHDEDVSPRYIISCPSGLKHDMRGRGRAPVYQGSFQDPGPLLFLSFPTQCTNCHIVLASEGNMIDSGIIGRYVLHDYLEPVGVNKLSIYGGIDGSFYGSVLQDDFWAGFAFYAYS